MRTSTKESEGEAENGQHNNFVKLTANMEKRVLAAIADLASRFETKTEEVKTELKNDIDSLKSQLARMDQSLQTNSK